MMAVAIMIAFAIALVGNTLSWNTLSASRINHRTHAVVILMLLLAGYAWIQTVSLSAETVHWLSPASHDAYLTWAAPLMEANQRPSEFPISIAPLDTQHTLAMLVIACLAAAAAPVVYGTRERIAFLLASIALGGAITAVIGITRKLVPSFQMWSFTSGGEGAPFGTFLNRNNAALTMNLALASCLGLLTWRLRSMSDVNDPDAPARRKRITFSKLQETFGNPLSLMAIACGLICLLGVALCGSRGGILSLLVSGIASVAMVRSGRAIAIVLIAVVIVGGGCVLLALPSELSNTPLDQLESSLNNNADRLTNDGRLAHWPDGFRTFLGFLPMGSGLATYSYAYLPFQQTSSWRWHHHADNLWLEMLVELGVGGLLIWTAFWMVMVWSLVRLSKSYDPIDEAMRLTGWYCVLLLLISQFFDFGLIIPSNLIIVCLLIPVIVSRAASVIVRSDRTKPQQSTESEKASSGKKKLQLLKSGSGRLSMSRWSDLIFPTMLAASLLGLGVIAAGRLKQDAINEYLVRDAKIHLRSLRGDLPELIQRADVLAARVVQHPTADLQDIVSRYRFQQGRLNEIGLASAGNLSDVSQLSFNTARTVRRLAWRASSEKIPLAATKTNQKLLPLPVDEEQRSAASPYGQALQFSRDILKTRPLAIQPRNNLVYLEFVHQTPGLTEQAIQQAQSLYRNDPSVLFQFARYSADNKDYGNALSMYQRVIHLRPEMSDRVLNSANSFPHFPTDSLTPSSLDPSNR
ncbi:O-Antigen ligase [Stieleria varia]|uniref:O-Antigen ligase n=2 Tax=Stieleria varia TaxID=2528005 RepID=A0A5C6B240_9BACT|nr:O-Antigen ligase [Stieleria varia]